MPSFAESLEATLHNALKHAGDRAHEYATLEHLLLALIDDADAAKVMQACGVDLGELSDIIITYLDNAPAGFFSTLSDGQVDYIYYPSPMDGTQNICLSVKKYDETYFGIPDPGSNYVVREYFNYPTGEVQFADWVNCDAD